MQGVLNGFNGAQITNYSAAIKGLNLNQAQLLLTTQGLNAERSKEILIEAGLLASENAVQAELLESALIKAGLGKEEREEILRKLGLIAVQGEEAIVQGTCTAEDLRATLAQKLKNEADVEGIMTTLGLAGANKTATASVGLLTKSIWANIKAMAAWMVSNPLGWLMLAGIAIAGVAGFVDLFTTSVKEHEEELENLKSEYSEIKSELDGLNNELQTTQSRIAELESKDKLTFTEGEELENLRKQNNELQRSIDLAKLKEKEANKKKNAQFVTTMSADVDNAEMTVQTGQNPDGSVKQEIINETAYIERQYKLLQEYRDKLKQDGLTENEKKIYQSYIDDIEKYISEKNDEFAKRAEGIDYIQNPTTKDDEKVNEWLDYINDFQDKMAIAMGGDNAKTNAFNRIVDNWKFDELLNPLQDLGKEGKVTAEMLNDPKYDEFIQKLIDIGFISGKTDEDLQFVANAFNGVGQSAQDARKELVKYSKAKNGITEKKLNTEDDIRQLIALANAAGASAEALNRLEIMKKNLSSGASRDAKIRGSYTKRQIENGEFDWGFVPLDPNDYIANDTPPRDDDKGKDNTPSYEDTTDAIINRINLRSKELEKQEQSIEDALEIAEIEKDYKKQISLTNDLIATRKKRVEELNNANADLHNEAEWLRNNNPWDEDSWFDSQGEFTEAYYNTLNSATTKDEQETIKTLAQDLQKYKKAYAENAEEIVGLNKEIIQDEKKIANIRDEYYDSLLDDIDRYTERIEKSRQEEIDALDKQITKEEALLKIKQGQYDTTNKLKEAQKDIDKEIANSRNSKEYLSESEYEKIFGEADYEFLSGEIENITNDIARKSADFYQQIEDAYANDQLYLVEAITAEYERQLASKERELEIAKAKVDLEKKRLTLENAKNERNIKQYSENGIAWVADQEKVKQATEDFIDAQATIKDLQEKSAQQMELDRRQANIDMLNSQKESIEYQNELMNKATENLKLAIEDVTDPLADLGSILQTLVNDINGDISKAAEELTEELNGSGFGGGSGGSGGGGSGFGGGGSGLQPPSRFKDLSYTNSLEGTWDLINSGHAGNSNAVANIPGFGYVGVNVGSDGKTTTTGLPSGTVIHTSDRHGYEITGGDGTGSGSDGYTSKKLYDSGGFASGKGLMLKGVDEKETVLPPWLTKEILTPEYNEIFSKLLKNMQMVSRFSSSDFVVKPQTDSLLMKNINQPTSIAKTWTGNMYVEGGDPNEVLKAIDQAFDRITI